jgi:hypothetical protein
MPTDSLQYRSSSAILRRMHGGELRHAQATRGVGCSLEYH